MRPSAARAWRGRTSRWSIARADFDMANSHFDWTNPPLPKTAMPRARPSRRSCTRPSSTRRSSRARGRTSPPSVLVGRARADGDAQRPAVRRGVAHLWVGAAPDWQRARRVDARARPLLPRRQPAHPRGRFAASGAVPMAIAINGEDYAPVPGGIRRPRAGARVGRLAHRRPRPRPHALSTVSGSLLAPAPQLECRVQGATVAATRAADGTIGLPFTPNATTPTTPPTDAAAGLAGGSPPRPRARGVDAAPPLPGRPNVHAGGRRAPPPLPAAERLAPAAVDGAGGGRHRGRDRVRPPLRRRRRARRRRLPLPLWQRRQGRRDGGGELRRVPRPARSASLPTSGGARGGAARADAQRPAVHRVWRDLRATARPSSSPPSSRRARPPSAAPPPSCGSTPRGRRAAAARRCRPRTTARKPLRTSAAASASPNRRGRCSTRTRGRSACRRRRTRPAPRARRPRSSLKPTRRGRRGGPWPFTSETRRRRSTVADGAIKVDVYGDARIEGGVLRLPTTWTTQCTSRTTTTAATSRRASATGSATHVATAVRPPPLV